MLVNRTRVKFAVDIGVDVPVTYDLVCSTEQISFYLLRVNEVNSVLFQVSPYKEDTN